MERSKRKYWCLRSEGEKILLGGGGRNRYWFGLQNDIGMKYPCDFLLKPRLEFEMIIPIGENACGCLSRLASYFHLFLKILTVTEITRRNDASKILRVTLRMEVWSRETGHLQTPCP
jgi:hypothetical protein